MFIRASEYTGCITEPLTLPHSSPPFVYMYANEKFCDGILAGLVVLRHGRGEGGRGCSTFPCNEAVAGMQSSFGGCVGVWREGISDYTFHPSR